tara:strand:+ start:108 stop:935 length:828 start_codon:yes stop_codon:yes gene_type:complete
MSESITQKPMVVYLACKPLGIEYLKNFIKNYKYFDPGHDHDLVICFKQFDNYTDLSPWKKEISFKFIEFYDDNIQMDYDIGSYLRVAKNFPKRKILFLGTYTVPNKKNWLKIFINHYSKRTIIGSSGSWASLASQFLNLEYSQYTIFQQIRWGLFHFLKVKLFPNPHIRTTGFFINSDDLLQVRVNRKKLIKKIETNYFESGRNGLSNQLIKKGFKLIIVNSDNQSFEINEWIKSKTFCLGNQEKLIFLDNKTDQFSKASNKIKERMTQSHWGNI